MAGFLKRPALNSPLWPALLSGLVAPGIGQFFNKDFKKGAFLLGVTLVAFFWFSKVVVQTLSAILPADPSQWLQNPEVFRDATVKIVNQNPDMFLTFHVLVLVVWSYGVLDAYFTARERLKSPREDENHHLAS